MSGKGASNSASWRGTAFDFEHLFSSFHKRSVRDSAYITSFLAKPLSRCSARIQESGSLCWTSATRVVTDRFRIPSDPFGLALLSLFAASVRARKVESAMLVTVNYITRECYHNRAPCPGSLLIWKALNTVQNQTPFSVVGRSFAAYGGSYAPDHTQKQQLHAHAG